jgi:hypothetical protein
MEVDRMSLTKKIAALTLVIVAFFSGSTKQLLNVATHASDAKGDHSGATGI